MKTAYPLHAVRTLALHAQGLATRNGSEPEPTEANLLNLIHQLVALQIDTLQRVQRTQYLVPWSRLGCFDPALLDTIAYGDSGREDADDGRRLFEYWFHAACYLPLEEYRYRLPRMRSSEGGRREATRKWLAKPETQKLLRLVYKRVEREGGLRARDFEDDRDERGLWWDWKPAKNALEYLFNTGDLMIANRVGFERVYDLAERVRPHWVDVNEPAPDEAALHMLERSARALGICTLSQIADYIHDFGRVDARPYLELLLERGVLTPVNVEDAAGKVRRLVVHKDNIQLLESAASGSLVAERTTFLSPFDSFFYPKGRDQQLWGFHQVLEAYKPKPQRKWGYYCLPILHHDRLVGRFDPSLDRTTGRLTIEALYLEPGVSLEDEMLAGIAMAMRDFMRFHQAEDLTIKRSLPRTFARSLLDLI